MPHWDTGHVMPDLATTELPPLWMTVKYPVAVFVGGGVGAVTRWGVNRWLATAAWTEPFPWATFLINVVGSFLLGVLVAVARDRPGWYALLGTGFCGGFTTFSTFSVELLKLLDAGRPAAAVGYAVGSVLAALLGTWLGVRMLAR